MSQQTAERWWVDSWTTEFAPQIVKETLIRKIASPHPGSSYELPSGATCNLDDAILTDMADGDELWLYCSDPWTWEHECGKAGFAILRHGEVREFCEAHA